MQLSLSHEGEFGFTAVLTLKLDKENSGLFAQEVNWEKVLVDTTYRLQR
ncbi:MAG: hypothetical protein PUI41_09385 [Lachnospiraceae bacterium]|nr:hypothetical protein [Lachnospiraceae bacterium]MDD7051113.1 hypothetical protein [Lachnospiraceae bacterium]MDY4095684.1 hypothetical protein [Lachnospiraceae bacterium]